MASVKLLYSGYRVSLPGIKQL